MKRAFLSVYFVLWCALWLGPSVAIAIGSASSPNLTVRVPDGNYITVTAAAVTDAGLPDGSVVVDQGTATSCFCVTGLSIATVTLLDGGITSAPHGVTLGACTGAGCFTKPCTVLWVGDGHDETWPAGCPLQ